MHPDLQRFFKVIERGESDRIWRIVWQLVVHWDETIMATVTAR